MSEFRILLTGGGSGGPTTPLLAVYASLQESPGTSIRGLFFGSHDGPERAMVEKACIPFQALPSGKLRRYWSVQNFIDPFKILGAFFLSFKLLWQFKPHVVISAGSFVSVPVAYAAWVLRIPHVIFQMDVKPGLANRLMAPVSQVLTYLFDVSAGHFNIRHKIKIGPVVRKEIVEANADRANIQFGLKPDKPVLLITGGGLGALKLNQATERLLSFWLKTFQVVHLTGSLYKPTFQHEDYHPLSFVHEGMGDLIARSDLVITRAGLGIIGELAQLSKDAILIPMPGTHQEQNAGIVADHGGCYYWKQQHYIDLEESGWIEFMEQHQAGTKGRKLNELLPSGGAEQLAEILKKYSTFSK
ncbi:MAG: UDP-N-acetylglucosamine--N-acetylmuramyl-(pentapeptide) pyrophosphoryl-undecaprenol N-acetylglucosamine transferase [SAR324 cluster bacterium]|nr:UDP-N-acetylglucosamine--N-acetylmuramyl-(pentapeptide) pyrophosphoryl-undecaprenol N-acetylglucosamine transferase [SAR324 cluster bacterium]